jgi:hypothetical protein
VRRIDHRAKALLAFAQRGLGARARGDVEDRADQAAGKGRLVVDGLALAPVAGDDRDRVALAAAALPELAVLDRVLLRDLWVLRVEILHALAEERLRHVERLRLHVLRQRERDGAGLRRRGEDAHRLRECGHDLFWPLDPIPVA